MKIVESDKFKKELNNILAFIAKDSVSAKNYFSKSLKDAILCIDNAQKTIKSIYFILEFK
ncbi:plasmid stabilization system protein [Campylobacter jejuni subsp. doylei]|uniref:Plasmid stabilization system protein n=1 Tax=Campylobacter jejuni subsp. doylei TaxID=32021 RepID=A0A3S4STU4_CAMJU|nr:plasmid stabilization system protein [Campylobacter jejuni subsp. doylei]